MSGGVTGLCGKNDLSCHVLLLFFFLSLCLSLQSDCGWERRLQHRFHFFWESFPHCSWNGFLSSIVCPHCIIVCRRPERCVSAQVYLCIHKMHPDSWENCLTCFQFIYPPAGKSLISFHLQIFFISLQCRGLILHWSAMCS